MLRKQGDQKSMQNILVGLSPFESKKGPLMVRPSNSQEAAKFV